MCQDSLRLKEVQTGTHDFKYNKVPFFALKTGNINTSMFATPKLVLVPASRYKCDVTWSYHNACSRTATGVKTVIVFYFEALLDRN